MTATRPLRPALALVLAAGCAAALPGQDKPPPVTAVPKEVRAKFNLAPFYARHVDLDGFPVVASDKVSDKALQEAAYLIRMMTKDRPEVLEALTEAKVRFAVMAPTEMTTDVPEHSDLKPKDYWDRRARGLGATPARPAVSCGEENLLNLKGDRYSDENILTHEFGHAIHEMGLRRTDPTFDGRLRAAYKNATDKGRWKDTYAATNHKEYWAEGVQSYFDANAPAGGVHNDVNTREKLAAYDPELFTLLDEVFKKSPWRYVRYDKRRPADK